MNEYEIVRIGKRHVLNDVFCCQEIEELYPLDCFEFTDEYAIELTRCIIDGIGEPEEDTIYPIFEYEMGVFVRCVAVCAFIDGDFYLTTNEQILEICNQVGNDAYYPRMTETEQWSKIMQIVNDNGLLGDVIDFIDEKVNR